MRVSGVQIPDNKKISIALRYLYGVGPLVAEEILATAKIDPLKKAKDLTPDEIGKIQGIIEKKYKIEGELRQIVRQNIGRLKDIKAYRGLRHMHRLPTRGQRTKTNSRTLRGNTRKTAGSGKRKVDLK
jgi:small subunit ribosomal protein S13